MLMGRLTAVLVGSSQIRQNDWQHRRRAGLDLQSGRRGQQPCSMCPPIVVYFNYEKFATEYLLQTAAYVCQKLSDLVKAFQRQKEKNVRWNRVFGPRCICPCISSGQARRSYTTSAQLCVIIGTLHTHLSASHAQGCRHSRLHVWRPTAWMPDAEFRTKVKRCSRTGSNDNNYTDQS